jgi:hypothetical protein
MAVATEKISRQILRVTIQHVLYPITESVLHHVCDPYGPVDMIEIFLGKSRNVVFIIYGSHNDVPQAFKSLQGRNIYDGCCQLDIELLPILPSSDATKLKVMPQQDATKVDAPQQDTEAKVQQDLEAAQTRSSSSARGRSRSDTDADQCCMDRGRSQKDHNRATMHNNATSGDGTVTSRNNNRGAKRSKIGYHLDRRTAHNIRSSSSNTT